jgi:hypothetical protein
VADAVEGLAAALGAAANAELVAAARAEFAALRNPSSSPRPGWPGVGFSLIVAEMAPALGWRPHAIADVS